METRTEQDLCSSDIIIDYLIFGQKKELLTLEALSLYFLIFHVNCLLNRGFTCSVEPCFLLTKILECHLYCKEVTNFAKVGNFS